MKLTVQSAPAAMTDALAADICGKARDARLHSDLPVVR